MCEEKDKYNRYAALLDQCDKELDEVYHCYAQQHNISDAALWILYAIYDSERSVTQAEICSYWFFSRQTINTALKGLEQQGIIQLVSVPGNRKSKNVVFTLDGSKKAERIIAPLKQAENSVFAAFTEEENRMFVELSQKRCELMRRFTKM